MTEEKRTGIRFLLEEHKWAWNRFPQVVKLYLHLLDAALPEDEPYAEIMLRRGDVICSLKSLSEESGLSIAVIRTALKKLTGTMDVESVMYGNTRIIHIRDYDLYMGEGEQKKPREAGAMAREVQGEVSPADDSGRKQGSDTRETGTRHEDNRKAAGIKQDDDNAKAAPRIGGRKAPTVRRILPAATGGYRGAYYSGAARVCENTESLVTPGNPEKETESKTINHTHSYHTLSAEPGGIAVQGYTVPVVIRGGNGGSSGTSGAGSYGHTGCVSVGAGISSGAGKGMSSGAGSYGHTGCVSVGTGISSGAEKGMPSGAGKGASALFEKFWEVYPRHVNRYQARCAFERLNPDAGMLDEILKVLDRQKESQAWRVEEGRYIPYPARWLTEHRWEDDPAEAGRKFRTRQEYAPKYTVPAQNYEQRDYSEEMETPEEMLARLQRGCGSRE